MAAVGIVPNWSIPREWEGETAFILGGGASLIGFDADVLRGHGRVIAIKDAGFDLAPWADVLYWADKFWCDGNHRCDARAPRLGEHTGKYKITRSKVEKSGTHVVHLIEHDRDNRFSTNPKKLAGIDSGSNCINLAALFGAKRIILLGFDMHGKNWDGRPRRQHTDNTYKTRFMPSIAKMVSPLADYGVEVINCTPKSALGCFPLRNLEDILSENKRGPGRPRKNPVKVEVEVDAPDGLSPPVDAPEPEDMDALAPEDIEALRAVDLDPPQAEVYTPEAVDVPEIFGLEMYEGAGLNRQIRSLGNYDAAIVRVRSRGADIITHRSAAWWRLQLSLAFQQVLQIPTESDTEFKFQCHKTPV